MGTCAHRGAENPLASRTVRLLVIVLTLHGLSGVAADDSMAASDGASPGLGVASGRTTVELDRKDIVWIQERPSFLSIGFLLVWPLEEPERPIEISAWGRGADMLLFDAAPLWGVFGDLRDASALRELLVGVPVKPQGQGGSDLELLSQALASATVDDGTREAWQKRVALREMERADLTDIDQLWNLYEQDRNFAACSRGRDLGSGACGQQLRSRLWPKGSGDLSWPELLEQPSTMNVLSPVLRTQLQSVDHPRIVGYILTLPKDSPRETNAEIRIATTAGEPRRVPIKMVITGEGGTTALGSFFKSSLPSVISGFVGAGLGAVVAYLLFRAQQGYLKESQIRERFEQRKIENSEKIATFLETRYTVYRGGAGTPLVKIRNIRKAMIQDGIYALLTPDCVGLFGELLVDDGKDEGKLERLEEQLKRDFPEFLG